MLSRRPDPGGRALAGPCGDSTRSAAGWGVPGAPGKRNLSPKPGGEGSVGGATPTSPSRPDARNDPPGHRPALPRSRAPRGPGAPSTCVPGRPGGNVRVPERPGASAFMGTRRGRAGAAGAAEEVTCSGGRFPCVGGKDEFPRPPAPVPGYPRGPCRDGRSGRSCGVQSLLSLKEHPPHMQGQGRGPLAANGGGEAVG